MGIRCRLVTIVVAGLLFGESPSAAIAQGVIESQGQSCAQPPKFFDPLNIPRVVQPPPDTGPRIEFSLLSPEDVFKFRRTQEVVRINCVSALERYAKGESKDRREVEIAILLIVEMHTDYTDAIEALCDNITRTFRTNADGLPLPEPLKARNAAKALISIGGPRTATTMIRRLRKELTDDELRHYTFVLYMLDTPELTARRLAFAIEKEKANPPYPRPDLKYIGKLEQIKKLISDPDFAKDRNNWPARDDFTPP